MADLTLNHKNNQKKKNSAFCSGPITIGAGTDASDLLFNLPAGSVVVDAGIIVLTAGAGTSPTAAVKLGSNDIVAAASTATAGVVGSVTKRYTASGGTVSIAKGGTYTTDAVVKVYVEYIETEKTTGEYTI